MSEHGSFFARMSFVVLAAILVGCEGSPEARAIVSRSPWVLNAAEPIECDVASPMITERAGVGGWLEVPTAGSNGIEAFVDEPADFGVRFDGIEIVLKITDDARISQEVVNWSPTKAGEPIPAVVRESIKYRSGMSTLALTRAITGFDQDRFNQLDWNDPEARDSAEWILGCKEATPDFRGRGVHVHAGRGIEAYLFAGGVIENDGTTARAEIWNTQTGEMIIAYAMSEEHGEALRLLSRFVCGCRRYKP